MVGRRLEAVGDGVDAHPLHLLDQFFVHEIEPRLSPDGHVQAFAQQGIEELVNPVGLEGEARVGEPEALQSLSANPLEFFDYPLQGMISDSFPKGLWRVTERASYGQPREASRIASSIVSGLSVPSRYGEGYASRSWQGARGGASHRVSSGSSPIQPGTSIRGCPSSASRRIPGGRLLPGVTDQIDG